jgi:hypothetical protein
MSKKEVDTKVSSNDVIDVPTFKGKTDEELKEIAQTLQTQRDNYQTMAVKAQGALEVVLQMLPEEKEKSEG